MDNTTETKIVNNGGTLWIMGLKTDNDTTAIESIAGARTEVDGALVQAGLPPSSSRTCTDDSRLRAGATVGEIAAHRAPFAEFVTEIRGSETKTLKNGDTPQRTGNSTLMTLFSSVTEK